MAQLDRHVDRVLRRSEATKDDRLGLLAVAEGRRNVDTLMRLLVVHAAEQTDAQRRVVAKGGFPPTVFDDHPEAIRDVLRMLVESGAATLPPADDQPEQEQEHQRQDNDEGTAPTAVSV